MIKQFLSLLIPQFFSLRWTDLIGTRPDNCLGSGNFLFVLAMSCFWHRATTASTKRKFLTWFFFCLLHDNLTRGGYFFTTSSPLLTCHVGVFCLRASLGLPHRALSDYTGTPHAIAQLHTMPGARHILNILADNVFEFLPRRPTLDRINISHQSDPPPDGA